MRRKQVLLALLLQIPAQLLIALSAVATDNFLILIADDVGVDKIAAYRDGECVNLECPSPPATPSIDALAAGGLLFRNVWATPYCSSSRATLLTGRHPFRTGVGGPLNPNRTNQLGVDPSAPNIANALKAAGYDTAAFGKWHMAGCPTVNGECTGDPVDFAGHPIQTGFDYYAGAPSNLSGNTPFGGTYCDWPKMESQRTGPGPDDYTSTITTSTTYATVDTVDDAISYIPQMAEPWLAWVAFNASHIPLHSVPADPYNCSTPSSGDPVVDFDEMTTKVDSEIGRLLASLAVGSDRLDRTTIIFLGDNGTLEQATIPPFVPEQAKGTIYEGGINVPFIVAGPQLDPLVSGTETDALATTTDLFATIMEIGALDPCLGLSDCADDSLSLVPHLLAPSSTRTFAYAARLNPNSIAYPSRFHQAVREARFKLLRVAVLGSVSVEFYDLDNDPFETQNLLEATLDPVALAAYGALASELNQLTGACVALDDIDTDCVSDALDNCPDVLNGPVEAGLPGIGNQDDIDMDGLGDACDDDNDLDPDDDGDGLLDIYETQTGIFVDATDTGTLPQVRDSDGDLVGDGNEVLAGTDPNDSANTPLAFTEAPPFFAQIGGNPEVLDFDGLTPGSVLSGAGFSVSNNLEIEVTLPPAVLDLLPPGGPDLDLIVVEDMGDNPATSGSQTLGVDDPGNLDTFTAGVDLEFSFDVPIEAFALSVVVREGGGSSISSGDLELVAAAAPSISLNTLDRSHLGTSGEVDYYAYFLATTSETLFSSVTLQTGTGVSEGAFFYNVDDIIAVPEAQPWSLLVAGCGGLWWSMRRRSELRRSLE